MEAVKTKMERFLGNICRSPYWHGIFNQEEVEYFFENFSDTQMCNGHLRQVEAKSIANNVIKLSTVSFK